jgi:hypothetical protein
MSLALAARELVWLAAEPKSYWCRLHELRNWFVVLAATLPVVAAFFTIFRRETRLPVAFYS